MCKIMGWILQTLRYERIFSDFLANFRFSSLKFLGIGEPQMRVSGRVSPPSNNDKILSGQRPLDNKIRSFEKFYIGWIKTAVINFLSKVPVYKDYTGVYSFQGTFPVDDILFHSEVFRHQAGSCPISGPEFSCVWAPNFNGKGPQISDQISQITLTS